ncbi:MAG: hypothetical protein VR71_02155 [Roseovarius sp. BRH_c41]|uniref:head-tail connector protein n=1 Tax=Roseovarius sp. BRH_c41 TaxID=1629709 RepID=UPI0005F16A60|nr:head-tail connector protein [Roseovarius sp. BRH_c41]KJS45238.1 MAG: hypothetical protein VR71_02155 [Roseovarius sp. BRH_c41]
MRLTLITAPTNDPVDLASAKQHCRVDHDDDDVLISSLITAAAQYLDRPSGILGRAVMSQVWRLELTGWPENLALPVEPVASVVVTYTDANGAEQTLDASAYTLSAWPSYATEWRFVRDAVRPVLHDSPYPVKFTITAGYANAAAVPQPLKTAMLMLVAHWYRTRETVVMGGVNETPMAFDALIAPYRRLV